MTRNKNGNIILTDKHYNDNEEFVHKYNIPDDIPTKITSDKLFVVFCRHPENDEYILDGIAKGLFDTYNCQRKTIHMKKLPEESMEVVLAIDLSRSMIPVIQNIIDSQTDTNDELRQELTNERTNHENTKAQLENERVDHENTKAQLENEINSHDETKTKQQKEIDEHQKRADEQQKQIDELMNWKRQSRQ